MRKVEELLLRYESIPINVRLFIDMFSHPMVLFLHLIWVVLWVLLGIHFLDFHRKDGLNLLGVKKSVAINVMESEEHLRIELFSWHMILLFPNLFQLFLRARVMDLRVLFVLFLHLVVFFHCVKPFLFSHIDQSFPISQLLFHFVFLKVFLSFRVQHFQVFCRRKDQFLEVFRFERMGVIVVHVFRI